MKNIILFLLLLLLSGCDIQKQAGKSKTETDYSESFEHSAYRRGDTITYTVPIVKHKDTTIYTVNRQGTTLRTVFDKQGNVASVDCYASMIQEIFKGQAQLQQSQKVKQKEKTEKFDNGFILYIICGLLLFLILTTLFTVFVYIKYNKM